MDHEVNLYSHTDQRFIVAGIDIIVAGKILEKSQGWTVSPSRIANQTVSLKIIPLNIPQMDKISKSHKE